MSGEAARSLFEALFEPRAVALVGASSDPSKNTARPLRFLDAHGFREPVHLVNTRRDEVLGRPAHPSVADLPEGIDHAFIMVPAEAVPEAVEQCADRGIPVATVYADGFAEAGVAGERRQLDLLELARRLGVRIVGPNSLGVVSVPRAMALSVNAALAAPALLPGSMALVSQSGTMIGAMLSRAEARGMGFSRMVSIGNECDIGVAELIELLVDDAATRTILLFLETIRDHAALSRAARRAFEAGKPVLAYKLGRSAAGRALARSHSGAITGSTAAVSALLAECGIVEVHMLETLLELAPMLTARRPGRGRRRVAVLTTTGGGAATVADRLGDFDVELAGMPAPVARAMVAEGLRAGDQPIIDLTMAGTRPGMYARVLASLVEAAACDAIVAVIGSSAQFHPEVAVRAIAEAPPSPVPIAAFPVPEAGDSLRLLAAAGVAAFRTPESCVEAVRAWLDWSAPRVRPSVEPPPPDVVQMLEQTPASAWDEARAGRLCELLGISRPHTLVLGARGPAPEFDGPVAVKALSGALGHKTEHGALELGVTGRCELEAAMERIRARVAAIEPAVEVEGFLVQEMVQGIAEVLVAFRVDAEAGPTITVGVGGVLTELKADVVIRPAPVDVSEAHAMISAVRELVALTGYRGLPRGDVDALARVVSNLSRLALLPASTVSEVELNPVIVRREGEGVFAVDALVVV